MINPKYAPRIRLVVTIVVVVTGIIAFIKIGSRGPFPVVPFIIWLGVSLFLAGTTLWLFLRDRKK